MLRKFDTSTYILEVVTVCATSPKRNFYIKKYIFGKATKFSKIKVGTTVVKGSFVVLGVTAQQATQVNCLTAIAPFVKINDQFQLVQGTPWYRIVLLH